VADEDVDEILSGDLQAAFDAQAVHFLGRAGQSEAAGDARVSAVGAHNDAGGEGGIAAVGLSMQSHVAVLAFDIGQASAYEAGACSLRLLGECFVPTDAVDGDGTSLVAANRDFAASGSMDEGPGYAVNDRVFADFGFA
jgi:hypothetical protein